MSRKVAVIGVEGCGVSHVLATLQRPAPRWCGLSSRAPRMQIVVNFLTININLVHVSVPPSCVNSQFGPRFSAELNDAEGYLVCYHANVPRSLLAATRLIKELIAYKRTERFPLVLCELTGAFLEAHSSNTTSSTSTSAPSQFHSVSLGRCISIEDGVAVAQRFGVPLHCLCVDPRYVSADEVQAAAAMDAFADLQSNSASKTADSQTRSSWCSWLSRLSQPALPVTPAPLPLYLPDGNGTESVSGAVTLRAASIAASQTVNELPGKITHNSVAVLFSRAKLVLIAVEQAIQSQARIRTLIRRTKSKQMQARAARKLLHYMGQEDETEDSPDSSSESDGLSSDDEAADEQSATEAKSNSDEKSAESDEFQEASDQRPTEALRPQTEEELHRRKLKHINNGGSSYSYMLSLFLSSPFGKVGVAIFAGLVMLMFFGSFIAPHVLRLPKANKFMIKMRTKQETLMFTSPTTYWHDYYLGRLGRHGRINAADDDWVRMPGYTAGTQRWYALAAWTKSTIINTTCELLARPIPRAPAVNAPPQPAAVSSISPESAAMVGGFSAAWKPDVQPDWLSPYWREILDHATRRPNVLLWLDERCQLSEDDLYEDYGELD